MNPQQIQTAIGALSVMAPARGKFLLDRSTWERLARLQGQHDPKPNDRFVSLRGPKGHEILWTPWVPPGELWVSSPIQPEDLVPAGAGL